MTEDLPRERLLKQGVKALKNEELIALLIHTGTKDHDVFELSKHVLSTLVSLKDLKTIHVQTLMRISGIKEAKATTIIAAIELGRRLTMTSKDEIVIHEPKDVYMLLYPEIGHVQEEHVYGLYLNTKGKLIDKVMVFKGSLNHSVIHPRELFKHAIQLGAAAVIFAHNHPTGDVSPSQADLDATEDLMHIGELLKINVIDHVIIGEKAFYSMKTKKHHII